MLTTQAVSEPFEEPVTPVDIKLYQGIEGNGEFLDRDPVLASRITSARQYIEDYCCFSLVEKDYITYAHGLENIYLYSKVNSITSVEYRDSANTWQPLGTSDYLLDDSTSEIVIINAPSVSTIKNISKIKITYNAGYTSPQYVPKVLKDAIVFIVVNWEQYQQSEDRQLSTIRYAVKELIQPYKRFEQK